MTALVAVVIGLVVGGVTAGLIALTMVTFSIASTPDWSLRRVVPVDVRVGRG